MSLNSVRSTGLFQERIKLIAVCSTFIALITCGSPVQSDPVAIPGTWEGYIGFGGLGTLITGDLTLEISEAKVCTVNGEASGLLGGTDYIELEFEGLMYIDVSNIPMGDITVTRYRAGIDTVQITAIMSGEFNLVSAGAFGEWHAYPDQAFSGEGNWTVLKR